MRPYGYIASSWRNRHQPGVVTAIREVGFNCYDFRNPAPGEHGFSWQEVDPEWQMGEKVDIRRWHAMSSHARARAGYRLDAGAIQAATFCVLVLPSGRSAHLEAGQFAHRPGKRLVVFMPESEEPDLMYLDANAVVGSIAEVIGLLRSWYP